MRKKFGLDNDTPIQDQMSFEDIKDLELPELVSVFVHELNLPMFIEHRKKLNSDFAVAIVKNMKNLNEEHGESRMLLHVLSTVSTLVETIRTVIDNPAIKSSISKESDTEREEKARERAFKDFSYMMVGKLVTEVFSDLSVSAAKTLIGDNEQMQKSILGFIQHTVDEQVAKKLKELNISDTVH